MDLYNELIRVARARNNQREEMIALLQRMVQEKVDPQDIQSCMYRLNGTIGFNLDHVLALNECMDALTPKDLYTPTPEHKDLLLQIDEQKKQNQQLALENQATESIRAEIELLRHECEDLKVAIQKLEET